MGLFVRFGRKRRNGRHIQRTALSATAERYTCDNSQSR
ncbi:hypothetical protein K788_0007758 [Paraburkholderia caribensis MBA4]|uniref:Uncharacterized protein n=1 Tax=Paraburkholderia caribensis MBA4 TaxID=1323664 RepID=A0A0P0R6R4_9BURK|nr:hypothetical protein K788_0007758 [Paraburkholderia caribensis MBA4]